MITKISCSIRVKNVYSKYVLSSTLYFVSCIGKSYPMFSSCSASETFFGCEECEHNNEFRAIEVIGQDWSSEVVALFLEDWELGRAALSCHMAMDLLCQQMRDACWDSSESLGSHYSLCSQCREGSLEVPGESTVAANRSLSLAVDGL